MTDFDTLIENARSHCLSLDADLQQQSLALDQVEQALTRLQSEVEAEAQALASGLSQAGVQTDDRHRADEDACRRTLAFAEEVQSRLQSLEDRLRADLEALPAALTDLREQARAAAPALAEAAALLQTRVTELDSEVDQVLQALDSEMAGLEKQVRTLQAGALQQKQELQKQLAECLETGETLHRDGSQAGLKLFERMLEADTQVGGAALAIQDTLKQASLSASAGLREKHRALAAQLAADTQKIHESVREVENSYGQAVSRTKEQSQTLHSDLSQLCQNLEPLLRLHQDARKTGAM